MNKHSLVGAEVVLTGTSILSFVLIGVGDYNSDRKALYPSGRKSGSQGSSLKIRLYVGVSILPNF